MGKDALPLPQTDTSDTLLKNSAGDDEAVKTDLPAQDPGQKGPTLAEPPALPQGPGLLIDALALLPEKAILDEARLASILQVTPRTIRRMVSRFELPPPVRLAGRSVWFVRHVLAHIEAAADGAQEEVKRLAGRIRKITP